MVNGTSHLSGTSHARVPMYLADLVPSSQVPDLLILLVWVLCSIDADQFPNRDTLLGLDDFGRWDKHRGLIDIFHVDHYGGSGSRELHHKGSLVGHFYEQGVLALSLKIQALGEKKQLRQHFVRWPLDIRRVTVKGPWLWPATILPSPIPYHPQTSCVS